MTDRHRVIVREDLSVDTSSIPSLNYTLNPLLILSKGREGQTAILSNRSGGKVIVASSPASTASFEFSLPRSDAFYTFVFTKGSWRVQSKVCTCTCGASRELFPKVLAHDDGAPDIKLRLALNLVRTDNNAAIAIENNAGILLYVRCADKPSRHIIGLPCGGLNLNVFTWDGDAWSFPTYAATIDEDATVIEYETAQALWSNPKRMNRQPPEIFIYGASRTVELKPPARGFTGTVTLRNCSQNTEITLDSIGIRTWEGEKEQVKSALQVLTCTTQRCGLNCAVGTVTVTATNGQWILACTPSR